tara:strand:+ start:985 stop:1323 length:339 start_codon:yes stop_codon:yes gene_type:complete
MKKLEICDNDHSLNWVDFKTIIAGNTTFTLTYDVEKDNWFASITNGYNEPICMDFHVDDETAWSFITEKDYDAVKQYHKEASEPFASKAELYDKIGIPFTGSVNMENETDSC